MFSCVAAVLCIIGFMTLAVRGEERDGRWAILVSGASGDPELQKTYLKEITDLHAVLTNSLGFSRDHVVVLFDDPSKSPGMASQKSTRESFQAACRDMATRVEPGDSVFAFLEGHGDYDGKSYKLNLVGPDPTGEELASMLYSIPAGRFIIVNATNCSGASIADFARKNAVVITATKSGMEKNATHLGRYFVDAFKNNAADSDKNDQVSIMEAFSFAKARVENFYKENGSMQTEHPVLDDTGDGKAQGEPAPDNGEGLLARTVYLGTGIPSAAQTRLTPEQQTLTREARDLERQIDQLKYDKNKMPQSEYEERLESLLLRLAQINAKLPN